METESSEPKPARVRVPASTSNLGSGFDCIGLAVSRYLDAAYEPGDAPLRIERAGTLAALHAGVDDDVLARAFRARLAAHGVSSARGTIRASSDIPLSRGLGSSAAAVVAGLALADAVAGKPATNDALHGERPRPQFTRSSPARAEERLGAASRVEGSGGADAPTHARLSGECDRAALEHDWLLEATQLEGHPDNAAPAIFGGLVAVAREENGALRVVPLPLSPDVGFAYAAPGAEVSTAAARRALPESVPHAVATRALGRLAALLHGLAVADAELIRVGFNDELHVPYRLPLIPGAQEAMDAAREAGAWAVTISGSGSGLIAACEPARAEDVAAAMADAFRRAAGPDGVVYFPAQPALVGVRVEVER